MAEQKVFGKDSNIDVRKSIYWVGRAASKEITRHNLTGILVKGGWMVATDGHRLHAARMEEACDLAEGFWRVEKLTKTLIVLDREEDVIFPEWKNVIPKDAPTQEFDTVLSDKVPEMAFAKIIKRMPDGYYLNYGYFKDACDGENYTVTMWDPGTCVRFRKDDRLVLIMPFRD